jgi:hypothetical protein
MEAQNAADDAVRAAAIEADARCNAAYYRRHPNHFRANKPVPEEWRQAWAATGGNPALLHRAIAPSTLTQPIAPIAQPKPQTIQQPGQTRGGSFDRAAASESPGTGWGDYEPRPVPPIAQTPIAPTFTLNRPDPDAWLNELVNYPSVLVFGAPGSGKTTFAEELITRRSSHQVIAIDPHYQPGKWSGAEIVGAGFDYPAITAFMLDLLDIVQQRYQAYSQGVTQFPPITIIAEELTNWSSRVGGSEKLIELIPDARKIGLHFLFVAHDRTITALGGKSGLRKMLDATLCEVELLVKADASGVQPAMKARLKMPNQPVRDVTVPRFAGSIAPTPKPTSNHLEPRTQSSFEAFNADMVRESNQPSNQPGSTQLALSAALEPNPEPPTDIESRFAEMKSLGMNKAQIIFMLWQVKKGNSSRYQMASDFYDRLNSKYLEMSGDNTA